MSHHLPQASIPSQLAAPALVLLGCIIAAIAVPEANAQTTQAAGIVIYKSVPSDIPQYYNGAVFKTVKDAGAWLSFDVGQDKPAFIEKGLIIDVLDFDVVGEGNVLTMNIVNDSDAQQIANFSTMLKEKTASMPRLANLVKSTTSLLQNELSMYNSGNVRKDGKWINKLVWERELAEKMKSALIVAGRTYNNARLISSKDDTITLAHDGGIAKIPLKELEQKDKALLASTFKMDPAAFEPSSAVSSGPADMTPASNSGDLMKKMSKITFPTFQFEGATVEESIEYLRVKSREFDTFPDASGVKGVNIILRQGSVPSNASISMDLKNVPMLEALRFITELAQMKFRVEAHTVLVLPLSEDGSTAMTETPARSNPSQPIERASSLPAPPTGPRIPALPAVMQVESIGGGSSEREAIRDAQFNAVVATLEDHITEDLGNLNSKMTIERIGDDSARAADAYRKIAMKSGAGSVRVIIKTSITREKLVPLLLKLGFVE